MPTPRGHARGRRPRDACPRSVGMAPGHLPTPLSSMPIAACSSSARQRPVPLELGFEVAEAWPVHALDRDRLRPRQCVPHSLGLRQRLAVVIEDGRDHPVFARSFVVGAGNDIHVVLAGAGPRPAAGCSRPPARRSLRPRSSVSCRATSGKSRRSRPSCRLCQSVCRTPGIHGPAERPVPFRRVAA